MSLSASHATPAETIAPPASDSSYQLSCSEPRRRIIRIRHTSTSGTTPSYSTSGSPTCTQASKTVTAAGTHQCGLLCGSRSRISQMTSIGTAVPVWSGFDSSVTVPVPSDGASMIPAATSIRIAPSRPAACPRASSAAPSTSSV